MLEDLLRDIINEENVLMSVNTNGAVIEMRLGRDLSMRVRENWITIGDDSGSSHMHINKDLVHEIRFLKEHKENRTSYSIRLVNDKGERLLAAFFTKMHDDNGNTIRERVERYENIFRKYGSREVIPLRSRS